MTEKQTIGELQRMIAPLEQYFDQKIQHQASNEWYVITEFHFRESDMTIEFTYRTCHRTPVHFARPIAELFDGRFRFS